MTKRELHQAALGVIKLYKNDADLVRAGAEQHGIAITQGGMFEPMEKGAYNLRLPDINKGEVEELGGVRSVTLVCMDYRQSWQVAQERRFQPPKDAVIAVAGGAAQPQQARRQAMVEFLGAIISCNPSVAVNLAVHNGVCGGVNHFTGGEMQKAYQDSPAQERKAMQGYLEDFADQLQEGGTKPERIKTFIADVEGDGFQFLTEIVR